MSNLTKNTGATLADRLNMFKPYIPADTIPSSHLGIMERIGSCLPNQITPSLGFELHLSKPRPRIDFAFGIINRKNKAWLTRTVTDDSLPESWRNNSAWPGIREYIRAWSDPGDLLCQKGGPLWMAFDLTDPQTPLIPFPCVYISPVKIPLFVRSRIPEKLFETVGRKSLELLTGPDFHEDTWQKVIHCFRRLPPSANIFQLGRMFSRQDRSLKVCVIGISPDQILSYLENIGWAGSSGLVRPVMEWAAGITDTLCFSFSIQDSGVGSDLGIECHYHNRRQPFQEPRWHTFLEGLVNRGLCPGEKKEALLRWPKWYNLADNQKIRYLRRLSWIKLKWKSDSLGAKAYLGFATIRQAPTGAALPEGPPR